MKNLYFSICKIAFLFLSPSSFAAIVYIDLNPDSTFTIIPSQVTASKLCALDIDNDGNDDYSFRWDDYTDMFDAWFCHMQPIGNNEMVLSGQKNAYKAYYLQALSAGTTINANSNWGAGFPEPLLGDNANANFKGSGDVYVGIRFAIGANLHYGWVLLSFDNNKKVTIKSYAYESTAGLGLNAGEYNPTSNIEIQNNTLKVYPNPVSSAINISTNDYLNKTLYLYSIDGREVHSQRLMSVTTIVDLLHFENGIYTLCVRDDHGISFQEKIVKQ
jgi:hypothetical protein